MVPLHVEERDGPDRRFALRTVTAWSWAAAWYAPRKSGSRTAPTAARHRARDGGMDMEIPEDVGPLARANQFKMGIAGAAVKPARRGGGRSNPVRLASPGGPRYLHPSILRSSSENSRGTWDEC